MVILALGLLNQGWLTSIIPKDSNFEALSDQKAPGRQLASLRVRGGFRFGFPQVVMGFGFAARALAARTKRWKSRRACDRPKRCNKCRHVLGWVLSTMEGRLFIAQRSRACCIGPSKQAIFFHVNLCSSNFLFGKQVSENISNELSLYPHSSPFNCHRHAI